MSLTYLFRLAFIFSCLSVFAPAVESFLFGSNLPTACRCFPGEACWPEPATWQEFNDTLGGRLVATSPIAAICHGDSFTAYDSRACDELRNTWYFPETHLDSSSSAMAPFFTNNSCNPFLPAKAPCTLGNLISYAVNATSVPDYQKTIEFVRKHNIRLVIRNTGHDYLGKSTGAGAVAIWTRHSRSLEMIKDYRSPSYSGNAIRMGAGVENQEVYKFAHAHNTVVVGGNCPTVGMAGGYTQGGGHGPMASKFGLASDQVLEWDVVTGTGDFVTATPEQHSDLYWALCGGGGGTYGAVVSMTIKAHPSMKVSAANLTFLNTGANNEEFWDVVSTFQASLPAMVDSKMAVVWALTSQVFAMTPATAPGMGKKDLDKLMQPTLNQLKKHNISYSYYSNEFDSFLEEYDAMNAANNVSDYQMGGRLIPRSLVEQNNTGLIAAYRALIERGVVFSGVTFNVANSVASPDAVGVNPYWRKSIIDVVIGTPYNYIDWDANIKNQLEMTDDLLPLLEQMTPNGGVYLNEGDFRQPDFKATFYGDHYDRLNSIKGKYDPEDRFYALTAVGSDRWTQNQDGRLCQTRKVASKDEL